jgi:hypothetical protein
MPAQADNSTLADRYAAMKLLRENMFYNDPEKFVKTDIAEDLPGELRDVAPIFKNVLPSAAIISKDPDERKKQIAAAINRIKTSGESKSALGKEILTNVKTMGLGAIAPAFAISLAFSLLNIRNPKIRAVRGGGFRSPFGTGRVLKGLFSNPRYRRMMLRENAHEALTAGALGAFSGVAYPLLGHLQRPSDKSLEEAGQIMQEQPYITGLPASELLSVMRDKTQPSKLKNTAIGAGFGALSGGVGAVTPAILKLLTKGTSNLLNKRPIGEGSHEILRELIKKRLPMAASVGAGVGGLSGLLTSSLPSDEYQDPQSYQT